MLEGVWGLFFILCLLSVAGSACYFVSTGPVMHNKGIQKNSMSLKAFRGSQHSIQNGGMSGKRTPRPLIFDGIGAKGARCWKHG